MIIRLAYIYGATITEDNTRADAQFLRKAAASQNIVMKSTGSQFRSYCYLQDAASGILTALFNGESGEAYNVANKESNLTILEYAKQLATTFGVTIHMDLEETGESAGYSKMKQEILDASKLESLGWIPKNTINQGLQKIKAILEDEG
ncbi:MAG: NAD(P)-dependent oxidoreductase [Clostridiales bacterium]|nr:NAD(P)-dependent oxidoreductase [Clostridiales bacterium]